MTTDKVTEGESKYKIRENLKPALENFAGWVDNDYTLYIKGQEITVNENLTLNAVYATPINGRIFYDDINSFSETDTKNQYLFFKNDFTKIDLIAYQVTFCFIFAKALVKGISLGQVRTQFCELPHSNKPPGAIKAS